MLWTNLTCSPGCNLDTFGLASGDTKEIGTSGATTTVVTTTNEAESTGFDTSSTSDAPTTTTPGPACNNDSVCDPKENGVESCMDCLACGNGGVEGEEECDDGNQINTDDCVACSVARCGDGYRQSGIEACDDGDGVNSDEYTGEAHCNATCKVIFAYCGDGECQQEYESLTSCAQDGCVGVCGNEVVEPGEDCDTGGESVGCDGDCSLVTCSDGDVNELAGEECDDGNRDDSDGCSNSCITSHHVVFVTQTTWKGDLDGLEAADGKCNAAAGDAGLDGSYRAWLSTEGNVNAKARIGEGFTGVYELVDGTKVADGWAGLTSPPLDHEINVDEFGNSVMSGSVWTNTTTSGESAKVDLTGHCEGWDTTGNNLGLNMPYTGDLSAKDARWTKGDNAQSCNFERRLYCFQVGP